MGHYTTPSAPPRSRCATCPSAAVSAATRTAPSLTPPRGALRGFVARHAGHYDDALKKNNQVTVAVVESLGSIRPPLHRQLKFQARRAGKKNARDGTRYSRVRPVSYITHHTRMISASAVLSDVTHCRTLRQYTGMPLTPCSLFRLNQAYCQAEIAAPKLLPPARPRAARRPGVVHTDPMGLQWDIPAGFRLSGQLSQLGSVSEKPAQACAWGGPCFGALARGGAKTDPAGDDSFHV